MIRLYVGFMVREFQGFSTYVVAAIAGLFTNVVFGLLRAAVMVAMFAGGRSEIGGYDVQQTVTYVWLVQGLMAVVLVYGSSDLALRIRSGDIAIDLVRPVDLQISYWARDLGRAGYHIVVRGIPPVVAGAVLVGIIVPPDPLAWLAFSTSVILAVSVSFFFRFAYNLLSVWLLDVRGVTIAATTLVNVLSGFVIPIAFFPGWLQVVATVTPFPAMVQTPVDIFTGHVVGWDLLPALGIQLIWVIVLCLVGRILLRLAAPDLVVQGG